VRCFSWTRVRQQVFAHVSVRISYVTLVEGWPIVQSDSRGSESSHLTPVESNSPLRFALTPLLNSSAGSSQRETTEVVQKDFQFPLNVGRITANPKGGMIALELFRRRMIGNGCRSSLIFPFPMRVSESPMIDSAKRQARRRDCLRGLARGNALRHDAGINKRERFRRVCRNCASIDVNNQ